MSIHLQDPNLLPEFVMDHLGTSFRVILVDSVKEVTNEDSEPEVLIPDEVGLHKAVSWHRSLDPRKLSGGDIRYFRKSLGLKAKDIAESLDVSAAYFSRCEKGEKTMSTSAEKMLRLYVLLEIPTICKKAAIDSANKAITREVVDYIDQIRCIVRDMKLIAASDAAEETTYYFTRKSHVSSSRIVANDADGEWDAVVAKDAA